MALQSSGAISITDIRTELGSSSYSLRTLSAAAGFSTPDAMSEFYGYTSQTTPSVTTNAASSVTVTSVILNGNVTSDGGTTVTARGFYFGTNSNVTSNPTYGSGSGTGTFSLTRTGLVGSTTYYFAAYATNAAGTAVGSTLSFTTQAAVAMVDRCAGTLTVWGYSDAPTNLSSFNVAFGYGHLKQRTYLQHDHPNYGWTNQFFKESSYGYGSDTGVAASRTYGNSTVTFNSVVWKSTSSTSSLVENRLYMWSEIQINAYAAGYNVTIPSGRRHFIDLNNRMDYWNCSNISSVGIVNTGSQENSTLGNWASGQYGLMDGYSDRNASSNLGHYDNFSFNANVTSGQTYPGRYAYTEKRIRVS